jgi:hypothetical protein
MMANSHFEMDVVPLGWRSGLVAATISKIWTPSAAKLCTGDRSNLTLESTGGS